MLAYDVYARGCLDLTRYKVAAVPGVAFGHDMGVRISYCTTLDVLNEGISRFEEFCRSH